ncbi:flagellin [Methanolobus psychrophilus R15]|nr:flagellin [Methanolobus psychrophilus R15]
MAIEIGRGYEILPDNSILFNIWITNNTDFVINDLEVTLDHNESLLKLQGDRVQKLDSIPPAVARVVKFILKPLSCIHNELIEANITYRDHRWEKHVLTMEPRDIHCIFPFLCTRPISMGEFLDLSSGSRLAEAGLNFEGVYVDQVLLFLLQTCANCMYKVGERAVDGGRIVYLSGGFAGEESYYLLAVLIRKSDALTQVMLRAVSSRTAGTQDFLDEIVSRFQRLVGTARSLKDAGVIKNDHFISTVNSALKQSISSAEQGPSSLSFQDGAMQSSNAESLAVMVNTADNVAWHADENEDDVWRQEKERQRRKHEELERLRKRDEQRKALETRRLREWAAAEKAEKKTAPSGKYRMKYSSVALILIAAFIVFSIINDAPLTELIIPDILDHYNVSPFPSQEGAVEAVVVNFLTAVNKDDPGSAFAMYSGKDFLAPGSIPMIFKNKDIQAGGIKEINITSTEMSDNLALVKAECLVASLDISGREKDSFSIPIYFKLQNSEAGWIITRVSFIPLDMWEGKQSTQEVSSNLMVKNIEGVRAKSDAGAMSSTVDLLKINVGLNVGSSPVDLNNVAIKVNDGKTTHKLVYAGNDGRYGKMASFDSYSATKNLKNLLTGTGNPSMFYTAEKIRDEDGSFSQADPVINMGDLVTIYIATTSTSATGNNRIGSIYVGNLTNSALNIAPGTAMQITLTPDAGAVTETGFVTPSSYGTRENVQLYP